MSYGRTCPLMSHKRMSYGRTYLTGGHVLWVDMSVSVEFIDCFVHVTLGGGGGGGGCSASN